MRIVALARCRHGKAKTQEADAETWARELGRFPESVRYAAANLAAHSWDVTLVGDRLLISCAWYEPRNQFWYTADGAKTPLSEEEMDHLYPPVRQEDQRWPNVSRQSGKWRGHTITLDPVS